MRIPLAIAVSATLALAGCGARNSVKSGEEALARGAYKAAAGHFASATRDNPSSVPLLYNLGTARALAGDVKGAIAAFRDVLRFAPGEIDASEYLAAELTELGSQDALMEAHGLLEFVLQYRTAPEDRARTLNSLALVELAMHRADLATARLVAAADAAPDYAPSHYNLAAICAKDPSLAAATKREADLAAGLSSNPEIAEKASRTSASASARIPKPFAHVTSQEAAGLLKEAADASARRNHAKASELYAKASGADPSSLEAALNAANAMISTSRYADATPFFERAAALDPSRFDIALAVARLAYSTGDNKKALDRLVGSVIPSWPGEPQPFFLASYAYTQEKRYYEARIFGEIFLAKSAAMTPPADTSSFKGWLSTLPDTKFKP